MNHFDYQAMWRADLYLAFTLAARLELAARANAKREQEIREQMRLAAAVSASPMRFDMVRQLRCIKRLARARQLNNETAARLWVQAGCAQRWRAAQ